MTKKQRLFFKEILDSPSFAEAARRAGYSSKSGRVSAHRNITKYNDFFINLLNAAGIDIESLAISINRGLNSKNEHLQFKYMKLMLTLVEKVLKNENLEKELSIDKQKIKQTTHESLVGQLAMNIRVQRYLDEHESIAFIRRSDLPKNIEEIEPVEVIKAFDLKPITESANATNIDLLKEAKSRANI